MQFFIGLDCQPEIDAKHWEGFKFGIISSTVADSVNHWTVCKCCSLHPSSTSC